MQFTPLTKFSFSWAQNVSDWERWQFWKQELDKSATFNGIIQLNNQTWKATLNFFPGNCGIDYVPDSNQHRPEVAWEKRNITGDCYNTGWADWGYIGVERWDKVGVGIGDSGDEAILIGIFGFKKLRYLTFKYLRLSADEGSRPSIVFISHYVHGSYLSSEIIAKVRVKANNSTFVTNLWSYYGETIVTKLGYSDALGYIGIPSSLNPSVTYGKVVNTSGYYCYDPISREFGTPFRAFQLAPITSFTDSSANETFKFPVPLPLLMFKAPPSLYFDQVLQIGTQKFLVYNLLREDNPPAIMIPLQTQ